MKDKKEEVNIAPLEYQVNEFNEFSSIDKKYYADVSKKIIKLVKENKLEEALEILDKEIEYSYIPSNVLVAFCKTRRDLLARYKEEKYEKELRNISPLEMWNKVYNEKTSIFNISYFNVLLEKKDNKLDDVDLEIINKIFQDKKVDNLYKLMIMFTLKGLKITHDFKVYNNCLKKVIDVKLTPENNLNAPDEELNKKLADYYMKEPSKHHLSLNLLQTLYGWYFPEKIPFSNEEIFETIKSIISNYFDDTKVIENEIKKVIFDMIDKQNKENEKKKDEEK